MGTAQRGAWHRSGPSLREEAAFGLLLNEPAVILFGQASLIMRNLRTKRREDVGGGYTSQTLEVKANEAGKQQLTTKRNVEGPSLDKRLAVADS
jgi:hypothetical protein